MMQILNKVLFKIRLESNKQLTIIRGYLRHRKSVNYDENTIFLVGVPEYGNLGDQAITRAEVSFIQKIFPQKSLELIPEKDWFEYLLCVKQATRKYHNLCVSQGGGNMGEIYKTQENIRLSAIRNLKDARIIVFPQTIDYAPDGKRVKRARKIYEKHKNLTIVTREKASAEKMRHCFPNCKTFMTPDIVLSYNPSIEMLERKGVLFVERTDIEKNDESKKMMRKVEQTLIDKGYSIEYADTYIPEFQKSYEEQEKYLLDIWTKMRKSELIVTDRLHGVIFSIITQTPCVALNNATGKVKNFYLTWLQEENVVLVEKDIDIDNIEGLMAEKNHCIDTESSMRFQEDFLPLVREVKANA